MPANGRLVFDNNPVNLTETGEQEASFPVNHKYKESFVIFFEYGSLLFVLVVGYSSKKWKTNFNLAT